MNFDIKECKRFWIVWRPNHQPGPTKRHSSYAEAAAEAQRLAVKELPAPFYILECVAAYQVPEAPQPTFHRAIGDEAYAVARTAFHIRSPWFPE